MSSVRSRSDPRFCYLMKKNLQPILLALTGLLVFSSCSSTRQMMDRRRSGMEIPEEAEPYPKPTPRAKLLGELTAPRICYDVTFYDLNIEIDLENRKIAGYVNFHALAVNDFTELQFDLAKNMVLDEVNYKGKTLTYVREEDAVFVIFPAVVAGTKFQFRVTYHGEPVEAKRPPWDGGFVWEKDKADRDFVAVACEGDGASLWWPCKDHPTEEPDSMAINITVPSDIMCVANGRLREKVETDVKTTYKWFVTKPINNYNVSVNIANYAVIVDTIHSVTGIQPATYYVLDYNEAVAREHFKEARDMMRSLEKFFGPFPWWEDGYKLVETPYLGMEHQTAVAYGNDFKTYEHGIRTIYGYMDYIILHETAHEWWGNNITACDGADVWLHEGFAMYAEVLYVEDQLGYPMSIHYLLERRRGIQNRRAIVGPRGEYYWGFEDAYNKGAWILHTLRSVLDDDAMFFGILKGFQREFGSQIVCTEDLVEYINNVTGQDFKPFFDQYIFDRRPPTLEYNLLDDKLLYRYTGILPEFSMPLNVLVNKDEVRLQPTTVTQTLTIPNYATVQVMDWEYLILKKENPDLKEN